MRFKIIYRYCLILLLFNCQEQTNEHIIKFEEVLGKRKTEAVNLLVSDFEDNLEKIYPNFSLQKAYEQYLKDLIDPKEKNWEKFRFQTDETHAEFINSGLKDEIYITSRKFIPEKNDTLLIHDVNQIGKYMRALYSVRASDTLVRTYWDKREAGGIMQKELVVNRLLYYKSDFKNYFHKRIVVLEFSY